MRHSEIKERAGRYAKFVEWSDEDRCFIGRCPDLFDGGIHGDDEATVYAELCQAAEEWVESLHSDKADLPEPKKYSGKFVMRVDPLVHRRLAAKAKLAGESLNTFCSKLLDQAALF
jgi:predicted HicB family RNase H-like nuclease